MKSQKGIAREQVKNGTAHYAPPPNSMVYAKFIVSEGPQFAERLRKKMSRRTFRRVMNYVRRLSREG